MKKVVLASNNKHKIKEFCSILKEVEILSLSDIGFTKEIEENGTSFQENALIKAKEVKEYLKEKNWEYDIIADDSGLCCDALEGSPGIYSARYSGIHGNNSENRKKLISELKGKDKSAYFICVIALYHDENNYHFYEGKTYGKIIEEEKGNTEFGYDCIFYSNELNKTFGEATEEEKNKISHRGRAIKELQKEISNELT